MAPKAEIKLAEKKRAATEDEEAEKAPAEKKPKAGKELPKEVGDEKMKRVKKTQLRGHWLGIIDREFLPRKFTFNWVVNGVSLTGNQDFAKEKLRRGSVNYAN